jgi:predicted Zn finger-like uncharacterized protein
MERCARQLRARQLESGLRAGDSFVPPRCLGIAWTMPRSRLTTMLIVCPSCASRYELDAAKLGPGGRKVRCASCQTLWHVAAEETAPDASVVAGGQGVSMETSGPEATAAADTPDFPAAPSAEDTLAGLSEELERAAEIEQQISAVAAEAEAQAEIDETKDSDLLPPPARKRGNRGRPKAITRITGRSGLMLPAAMAMAGVVLISGLFWQRNLAVRIAPQLAGVFETLGFPVNVRGLSLTSVESGIVQDGQGRFLVVEGDVTNITRGITSVPSIEVAVRDASGQTLYSWTTEPPRPTLEPAELVRFRARLAAPPDAGKSVRVRFTEANSANSAKAAKAD